jgi:uncharacterized protein YbjT (DUF2867 family)
MKTAIVLGATGMVGSELTRQLLEHPDYSTVLVFVRRSTGITHLKLTEHPVDFDKPEQWKHLIRGDVLFSAMGTTLNKAGSKAAQYTIDYTYQYNAAAAAASNGVPCYVLISSAGASEKSMIFYSKMKGELDREIKKLPFRCIRILKPGILSGNRTESRPAEAISIRMMTGLGKIPFLKKYRPYPATMVAKAMINAALDETEGVQVFELEDVFTLAKQ